MNYDDWLRLPYEYPEIGVECEMCQCMIHIDNVEICEMCEWSICNDCRRMCAGCGEVIGCLACMVKVGSEYYCSTDCAPCKSHW